MIAEGVELRVIRIVACTYRIDIVALEQENVIKHMFMPHRPSMDRMDIMSVDTLEQHLLVIDVSRLPSDLNLAEAMTGVGSLYSIAVPVLEFQNNRVEIRLFL